MRKQRGGKEKGGFMTFERIYENVDLHLKIALRDALRVDNEYVSDYGREELYYDFVHAFIYSGIAEGWTREECDKLVILQNSYQLQYLKAIGGLV
jgi:hypothetical protein